MNILYYSEINLLCIIILILFRTQLHHKHGQLSMEDRVFIWLIWATVILCLSDMVAGICRGQFFWGARAVIEISNLIFFEALTMISYLWMIYVFIKLKTITQVDRRLCLWAIPLILFSIAAVCNPFTDILFIIDENNLYVRNVGIYLHWLVTWLYLIIATIQVVRTIRQETNALKRKEIVPLLYFIVAPFIASVIQMLFYGVTSTQVGITISIITISLFEIRNQIFIDTLTGLNNRNGFYKYLEKYFLHHADNQLGLLLIDVDNFKQVNDQFGHMVGERALVEVADALKQACVQNPVRLFICRYGGDEFLITGYDCSHEIILELKEQIDKGLQSKNQAGRNPYTLHVSIGTAIGQCADLDDAEALLRVADAAMYDEKKRTKHMKAGIPSR